MLCIQSDRKEFVNWSGGVPVLAIALLEGVAQALRSGTKCTKSEVDAAATATLDERRQILSQLWEDCDMDLRSDLANLAAREADGLPASEFADGRQRALEQRGLAVNSGNRMRASRRLIARFALQQAPAIADLKRLFGTQELFNANIRSFLDHRLAQVSSAGAEKDLRLYVANIIRDLDADPDVALKWVRSIASRALAILWEAELGPGLELPREWITEMAVRERELVGRPWQDSQELRCAVQYPTPRHWHREGAAGSALRDQAYISPDRLPAIGRGLCPTSRGLSRECCHDGDGRSRDSCCY